MPHAARSLSVLRVDAEEKRKWLGAVALAAIAVVVAAIAVSSTGGRRHGIQTGASASKAVAGLLNGIPQSGDTLGSADARVTIRYFSDLECPVCRDFTLGTLSRVIAGQVRGGRVQIEYRSLQTATGDPATFVAQQAAALAAGRQHRLWQYVELFYREQGAEGSGYVNGAYLERLARQVPGLDIAAWKRARAAPALAAQLGADAAAARQDGANATPTLVIRGPSGRKSLAGNVSYGDVARAVAAVG